MAPVFDQDLEIGAAEPQEDLDLVGRAAVTHGVGAGFADAEHHVVDDALVAAVGRQVVAHAAARPRQAVGLGHEHEALACRRRPVSARGAGGRIPGRSARRLVGPRRRLVVVQWSGFDRELRLSPSESRRQRAGEAHIIPARRGAD